MYLFAHGFGVEMAEALAELWHKRIREELGITGQSTSAIVCHHPDATYFNAR